jgi:hypothetical protein
MPRPGNSEEQNFADLLEAARTATRNLSGITGPGYVPPNQRGAARPVESYPVPQPELSLEEELELANELRSQSLDPPRPVAVRTGVNLYPGDVFDESLFDPADFANVENIGASTSRQINRGQFVEPPSQFQNFLNNIGTQSPQGARIQELVNKNPKLAEKIFNTSAGLGSKASKAQEKLAGINNKIYQTAENLKTKYQRGDFIPGFIARPLGLNNPLVETGGLVEGGARLNPEGIRFLQEQKTLGSVLDKTQLNAMGGNVTARYVPHYLNPKLDIAFQSATGYRDPSSLKKSKADAAAQIQRLENDLNALGITDREKNYIQENLKIQNERFKNFSNELRVSQEAIQANPLTSEAIRYQLGSAISAAPEGTLITASPIGGTSGSRARLYKGLSQGALETMPRLRALDPSQLPTNEEFRLAAAGGGLTPEEYGRANLYSSRGGQETIATIKKNPEQFETWRGQTVNWNPEELKDPLIRASLGLNKDVDVASLRQDPTSVFINTRPFNPELPVITTSSPQYQARQAIKQTGKVAGAGTKGFLLDAGINYALGASPQEALVTAISDPISAENLGGAPTAPIERLGPRGEFVDTRSNTVLSPQGRYTNTGIAYKGGKPVIVPRGSVAGEGNFGTQAKTILGNALNTWKQRLSGLGIFGR